MSKFKLTTLGLLALAACTPPDKQANGEVDARLTELTSRLDSVAVAATQARASVDSVKMAEARRVEDSIHVSRTAPRQLALITSTLRIAAPSSEDPGYVAIGFSLPKPGSCRLTGRLEVVAGGNKDVIVGVFGADDFLNWRNNSAGVARAYVLTGPQTVTNLNVPLSQAGTYYLVLSNRFSSVTSKTSTGTAQVTCIGEPTPVSAD